MFLKKFAGPCINSGKRVGTSMARMAKWYSTATQNNEEETFITPSSVINQIPNLNFKISERASSRLTQIYDEKKQLLKVSVESGGCHGFQYNLKLITESELQQAINTKKVSENKSSSSNTGLEDDFGDVDFSDNSAQEKDVVFILPNGKAKVAIDEKSLRILNKTYLTYTTELIGSTFQIKGGNMKSSCGCGSSFDIEV